MKALKRGILLLAGITLIHPVMTVSADEDGTAVLKEEQLIVEEAVTEAEEFALVVEEAKPQEEEKEGWEQTPEGWYYYEKGKVYHGWKNIDGKFYFLDGKNPEYPGLMVTGVKVISGVTYEFDSEGVMIEGWKYHDGEGWYYYGTGGHRQYGWVRLNGTYYFLDPAKNGARLEGVQVISGVTYEFDENGAMIEGWKYHDGEGWYYYGIGGHRQYGWVRLNGTYYFLDSAKNGARLEGVQVIVGVTYEFDENGAMVEGWKYHDGEGWYYYGIGGHRQYGWLKLKGTYYFLDPKQNGVRLEGVQNIAGVIYEFDQNGAMIEGWRYVDGQGYYYYSVGGHREFGWQKIGGKWYYFNRTNEENPGIMVADGEKVIDGQTYLFTASGAVFTGWMQKTEGWYFYTERGQKATGWQRLGNIWYYFDPSTKLMCTDQWKQINGNWYSFEPSGHMRQKWGCIDGKWYFFGVDGARKSGWYTIDGYRYYFYKVNDPNGGEPGVMATNVTIDGIKIDAYGHASGVYAYAAQVLDRVGWNLQAAFNWSAGLRYRNYSNSPAPGSEAMALYGFQTGTGDCYVMAATFYYMAELLGYDAHQVAGWVPLLGGGRGVHSWVEIDMNGGTYVFDPQFTNQTGKSGFQIYYGMSGTWVYLDYYRMN